MKLLWAILNIPWLLKAKKICKKLGIKLKVLTRKEGNCRYNFLTEVCCISVNIFNKHWITVFAHELGHYIDFKVRSYSLWSDPPSRFGTASFNKFKVNPTFTCEALASRCAMRLLKAWGANLEESQTVLLNAYNTYVPKEGMGYDIADVSYYGYKQITTALKAHKTPKIKKPKKVDVTGSITIEFLTEELDKFITEITGEG